MKRKPEGCLWALDARARNKWIRRAGEDAGELFDPVRPASVRCRPRDILICRPCAKRIEADLRKRGI